MLLRRSFVQQGGRTGANRPNWMEQSGRYLPDCFLHAAAYRVLHAKTAAHIERRFTVFLFGQLACGCTARRTSGSSDGSSSENMTAFAAQMPRRSGSVPKTNTGE